MDWNISVSTFAKYAGSRILYGCVDWNATSDADDLIAIVASFTDAWIETSCCSTCRLLLLSHPLRMRGLKRSRQHWELTKDQSHPLRMRGLKPFEMARLLNNILSHPLRMRGLKPSGSLLITMGSKSHPLRMRGLKQELYRKHTALDNSRILYGCVDWNKAVCNWIAMFDGRILYGCVDWNMFTLPVNVPPACRILYGCVDWNRMLLSGWSRCRRRILYGCVDWNRKLGLVISWIFVASFTDAWIETRHRFRSIEAVIVASFTDAWIETRIERT